MSSFRLAAALLFFATIAAVVPLSGTQRWDRAVTVWLQRAAPAPDVPAVILVFLGDAEVVIPVVTLAGLAILARAPRRGRLALWLAAGLVAVSALAVSLRYVIAYPGPPLSLQRPVLHMGVGMSSPFSLLPGHTMRAILLAGTLLRRMPLLAGALILLLAGLAILARAPRRGRLALWLAAGLVAVSALAVSLRYVIAYPGPPLSLQRPVLGTGLGVLSPFGFPSGHTMRATFLAGTLLRRTPFLAGASVLLMMAALVYLGDHWATDVLGGLCLGWACVEVARSISDRLS